MPLKYFEIKNLLRREVGLIDSIMNKVLKYLLLYSLLYIFFLFGKTSNSDDSGRLCILLLVMGILYRFVVLFERINIKNLVIAFKKGCFLNIEHTELLISEIEESLNKINNFANWSCGILATITIFIVSTFINLFKDVLFSEELSKVLFSDGIVMQNDLIAILKELMFIIILLLFTYYLTIQAFTYDRRFVNTVLKSSVYITEEDIIIVGFWRKLSYALSNFVQGF